MKKAYPDRGGIRASNYDVVSIAVNLPIYTTPSFEALTELMWIRERLALFMLGNSGITLPGVNH